MRIPIGPYLKGSGNLKEKTWHSMCKDGAIIAARAVVEPVHFQFTRHAVVFQHPGGPRLGPVGSSMSLLRSEIHFYSANEAGALIVLPEDAGPPEFQEILLFCCFATEQLLRSGKRAPILATTLALLLVNLRDSLSCLAQCNTPHHPQVEDYRGYPGNVHFVGKLNCANDDLNFRLSERGLSTFRRNKEHYQTHSILVLLRHLARVRIHDTKYLESLSSASAEVGISYVRGELSGTLLEDRTKRIALKSAGRMLMGRSRAVV